MSPTPEQTPRRGSNPRPHPGRPVPKNLGQPGKGPRDYSVDESALNELDEFHPPNPKNPLAGAKPGVVLGAAMMILALVTLVVFPFLPVNFPGWVMPAQIAAALLGLVILFMQMPSRRTSGGDGAQV